MGAKYIGTDECAVRLGDKPIKPGDVVTEPADVVADLLTRADFVEADASVASPFNADDKGEV